MPFMGLGRHFILAENINLMVKLAGSYNKNFLTHKTWMQDIT